MKNRTLLLLTLLVLAIFSVRAQNVGSLSTTGGLHLAHPSNGLLLPNVALLSTSNPSPLTAHVAGMEVYNTATANTGTTVAVTPGTYVNDGTQWRPCFTSNAPAAFTSSTIDCSGTLAGSYIIGIPMAASNTKIISITANSMGTYSATTAQINGVTFSASGNLYSAGTATQIVLTATGTPLATDTVTYTVTLGTQTCTFQVAYAAAATFTCASATQSQSPTGTLTATGYTGNYTIPYTSGSGTSYPSTTQIVDGLTLTRAAGVYAIGGGNVVYNLTGTHTGSNNTVTYTIPECSSVTFGDAIYGALSAPSQSLYNAAAADNWISITSADYIALQSLIGTNKYVATDALLSNKKSTSMGADATCSEGYNQSLIPYANYLIAVAFTVPNKGIPTTLAGIQFKLATAAITGPYSTFPSTTNAVTPNTAYTLAINTIYYYVLKRPTITTSRFDKSYVGYYTPNTNCIGAAIDGSVMCAKSGNFNGTFQSFNESGEPLLQVLATPTKQW